MEITQKMIDAFKREWGRADAEGATGNRVARGLGAALGVVPAPVEFSGLVDFRKIVFEVQDALDCEIDGLDEIGYGCQVHELDVTELGYCPAAEGIADRLLEKFPGMADGDLVNEARLLDSIAEAIWNDEQECLKEIRKSPVRSAELGAKLAGLQRARDITNGVLVRGLDEEKLAEVMWTYVEAHGELMIDGDSFGISYDKLGDLAEAVAEWLRGDKK